jgi:hypothetical protein
MTVFCGFLHRSGENRLCQRKPPLSHIGAAIGTFRLRCVVTAVTGAPAAWQPDAMTDSTDTIRLYLGDIPADEYEQRRRIRSLQNSAAFKCGQTANGKARALADIAGAMANQWLYAPASVEDLTVAVKIMLNLLRCADRVELLEGI